MVYNKVRNNYFPPFKKINMSLVKFSFRRTCFL